MIYGYTELPITQNSFKVATSYILNLGWHLIYTSRERETIISIRAANIIFI